MDDRPTFTAFVMQLVLLVVFLGLINMIFDLHRFAFFGEFLILLFLLLVGIMAVVGLANKFSWVWKLLTVFFGFVFLNMLFINAITTQKPELFLLYLLVTIAGFVISLLSIEGTEPEEKVKKTFTPGKYLASKMGSTYHAPKCDWAKRVKKKNIVWFGSKEEAKKAKYKAHDCVK